MIRARLVRGLDALESHSGAGLGFAFMSWGPLAVGLFGALPGLPDGDLPLSVVCAGMFSVVIWVLIRLLCRNRHLQTWGSVYLALAAWAGVTMLEHASGAVAASDLDGGVFVSAAMIFVACVHAVFFHVGGARRRIARRYRQSRKLCVDVRFAGALLPDSETQEAYASADGACRRVHAV